MKTWITRGTVLALSLTALAVVAGCGGGGGNGGNNNGSTKTYSQVDRLARPAINEVLATVANNRHQTNDQNNPTDDQNELAKDIQGFMTGTAGRSQAITDVTKSVLVPDVLVADLSQNTTKAAYLGVETKGATGSAFGGRALTDDVVDADLGVIFGNTIPSLGLAPDDGKEIPTLAKDNVGPGSKHFTNTFPYVGAPQ